MKAIYYFPFCALVLNILTSQAQFRDGYVITNGNDILHGQVYHIANPSKYRVCNFRNNEISMEFSPNEILGFGFTDDAFFSTQFIEGHFTEVLLAGSISMFLHKNTIYIVKDGDEPFPIEDGETKTEGRWIYTPVPPWKGKLIYYTSDCSETGLLISKKGVSQKELVNILKTYHNCISKPYVEYKVNRPWTRFEPSLFAGVGISSFQFKPMENESDYLNRIYYKPSALVGLQLVVVSPRINDLYGLEMNVGIIRTAKIQSLVVKENPDFTLFHESNFEVKTLMVSSNLRYTLINDNIICYLHVGLMYYNNFYDFSIKSEMLRNNIVTPTEKNYNFISHGGLVFNTGISASMQFPYFRAGLGISYFPSMIRNNLYYLPIRNYFFKLTISR